MSRRGLCAALLVLVGAAAPAAAQEQPIRVALYAPWGGPSDAQARRTLVQSMARAIKKATGKEAVGQAFAKYKDFEAALVAKEVDLALVDTAVAQSGTRLKLAGTWSSGRGWAVLAREPVRMAELRGRKLAVAATDAPTTNGLIERSLLRGQLQVRTFFGGTASAPQPLDAVRAVAIGKADCVIAPRNDAGTLRVVLDLGSFPELALAVVTERAPTLGAALPGLARTAISAALGSGWTPETGGLRGEVGLRRFVLAPPQPYNLRLRELFAPIEKSDSPMPLVDAWVPPSEEM